MCNGHITTTATRVEERKIISIPNHRQKEIGEIKTTSQMRARMELWQTHQNGLLLLCAGEKRHVNAASRKPSNLSLRANDWWQQRALQVNVPLGRQKDVAVLLHKTWKHFFRWMELFFGVVCDGFVARLLSAKSLCNFPRKLCFMNQEDCTT
jgi:hypothetical protein